MDIQESEKASEPLRELLKKNLQAIVSISLQILHASINEYVRAQ